MKIVKIEPSVDKKNKFNVTLRPSWLARLFGAKDVTYAIYDTGGTYRFGGGGVYINSSGYKLGPDHSISLAIDAFLLRKEYIYKHVQYGNKTQSN